MGPAAGGGSGSGEKRRVAKTTTVVAKGPKPRSKSVWQKVMSWIKSYLDSWLTDLLGRKGKKVFYAVLPVLLVLGFAVGFAVVTMMLARW